MTMVIFQINNNLNRVSGCFLQRKLLLVAGLVLLCSQAHIAIAQEQPQEQQQKVEAQKQVEAQTEKPKTAEEVGLIRLESTFVGDKEQPSVSYFIPWKGTDSPDGLRWNIERKIDDTLNLVDRDIMLRSMNIYNEMELE